MTPAANIEQNWKTDLNMGLIPIASFFEARAAPQPTSARGAYDGCHK
jgi:hypothetical protein